MATVQGPRPQVEGNWHTRLADLLYANELGPRALGRRYARTTVGQTVGDPVGCDAAI